MRVGSCRILIPVVAAIGGLAGCSGSGSDDSRAQLASDLVACKNEQSNLKDELAQVKGQLARAQAAAAVKLDPLDLETKGGTGKHMEGNVSPVAVIKVVRQNSTGLRACYEHALKRKPDLQYVSNVTARFSVHSNGSCAGVSFSPHTDAEMERCMAMTMEKWRFPTFQGDPVAFEQPVNLVAR